MKVFPSFEILMTLVFVRTNIFRVHFHTLQRSNCVDLFIFHPSSKFDILSYLTEEFITITCYFFSYTIIFLRLWHLAIYMKIWRVVVLPFVSSYFLPIFSLIVLMWFSQFFFPNFSFWFENRQWKKNVNRSTRCHLIIMVKHEEWVCDR